MKFAKTEDYSDGNCVVDLRTSCFNFQLLLFFFVLLVNYHAHAGFELGFEGFRSQSRLGGQVLGLGLVGSGFVNIPAQSRIPSAGNIM